MTPAPAAYREPASLVGRDVCCRCKRLLVVHRFVAPDWHWLETHHCAEHGDVAPMRSHVVHPETPPCA